MKPEAIESMQETPGIGRPKVVCLCGSSRFKKQILGAAQRETLRGHIVLTHGFYHHVDMVPISAKQKEALDALHLRKIDLCDGILVVNINGYVGESTKKAIAYAKEHDKGIEFLEEELQT
jgi:hypothetical protein